MVIVAIAAVGTYDKCCEAQVETSLGMQNDGSGTERERSARRSTRGLDRASRPQLLRL